jgi:hypothetical protein
LKELLSKEVDLPMETSVRGVPHRSGSEPVMEFALLDLSQTAEIFLSHFPKTTCRKLRAIRLIVEATSAVSDPRRASPVA